MARNMVALQGNSTLGSDIDQHDEMVTDSIGKSHTILWFCHLTCIKKSVEQNIYNLVTYIKKNFGNGVWVAWDYSNRCYQSLCNTNIYYHIGGKDTEEQSSEELSGDGGGMATVHGGSQGENMSATGKLHKSGRLEEGAPIESDKAKSNAAVGRTAERRMTCEYMAQCKYKLSNI